jgi:hypothetical protein
MHVFAVQVERVIGAEDVARFTSELAAEEKREPGSTRSGAVRPPSLPLLRHGE